MAKAFGIVNTSGNHIWVEGMQNYRPIGAFSFLGRYRIVDFPISNMTNSGIERIQVFAGNNPRSLIEHMGIGRHYNINSKTGKLQILFAESHSKNDIYNTDIAAFWENLDSIQKMKEEYVVIAPSYMIYTMDFKKLLTHHQESQADITLLYHSVNNATTNCLNCSFLTLNRQNGVLSLMTNRGSESERDIFMDTYIMKKNLFIKLIHKARELSSMYTLAQIINIECDELDVRGYKHEGYFAAITNFKSYYDANLSLIKYENTRELFDEEWPIHTRTNDSCPTHYYETANVKQSVISNGCIIEGTVENSIIGRGCVIKKGVVVKNSLILPQTYIEEGIHIENYVVGKHSKLIHCKELIANPETPGYVKRGDTL